MKAVFASVLTTALAVTIAGLTSSAQARPAGADPDPADRAIQRLRADARSSVQVHRDTAGTVDFVAAAGGAAIDNPALRGDAGPVVSATAHLDRYGAMFGLDRASTARVMGSRRVGSGGSLVRFQQMVDGLPVIGGELVVSLDADGDLTSILAETTTDEPSAVTATVSETQARATAIAATAKYRKVKAATLRAEKGARWLYDPQIIGAPDRLAARTVWRFEVTNGIEVRELVLVDAATGRIALHFSQIAHALNRAICDNNNVPRAGYVACTSGFARTEGGPAHAKADVNDAYDYSGATSALYSSIDGVDLTELIGIGTPGSKRLTSTVWWCFTGDPCPYPNAFWNGTQMFYGQDYATADDVVGHELTHGYTEKTSNLLYFYQSGAINESMSDVIGEIVDHRTTLEGVDSGWPLAEDLPIGAIRNMSNPGAFGDPDRMRSPNWRADVSLQDNGGVHSNSGVGNKTAYLISQGGTFNGQTVTGIDAGNPTLTKTAHLYIDVIAALTSGSDYADLGRVLPAMCDSYVAGRRFGFTAANCANVRKAIMATQLAQQPVSPDAAAPEAAASCPTGTFKRGLYADNVDTSGKTWSKQALWGTAPGAVFGYAVPSSATSGKKSYFGLNSDPRFGEPATSHLTSQNLVTLPTGQRSYLHFKHWYLFEYNPAFGVYFDGGAVSVKPSTSASWQTTATRPWVNGPTRNLVATAPQRAFGGSSHGYQSSRLDLSWLAGKRIQTRFSVYNDPSFSFYGWYVDDISVYTCPSVLPSAPRNVRGVAGRRSAVVKWNAPAKLGTGLSGFRIARTGGPTKRVGAAARSVTFTGLNRGRHTFTVRALNRAGSAGPGASVRITVTR